MILQARRQFPSYSKESANSQDFHQLEAGIKISTIRLVKQHIDRIEIIYNLAWCSRSAELGYEKS
jgi:hypothetical protein